MFLSRCLSPWLSRFLGAAFALLTMLLAGAPARASDDFLDPAVAFQVSARALPDKKVELVYKIAPGYYLYRERFKFDSPDAKLAPPQIPNGLKHYDTALEQQVEIYHDQVVVVLPVTSAGKTFTIDATHQGCAEKGLCYPPQPRVVKVSMKSFGGDADSAQVTTADAGGSDGSPGSPVVAAIAPAPVVAPNNAAVSVAPNGAGATSLRDSVLGIGAAGANAGQAASAAAAGATVSLATARGSDDGANAPASTRRAAPSTGDDNPLTAALRGGKLWLVVSIGFGLGLLMSMTPCVLPMLPILSSIIVGQGKGVTPARGLMLSASYSLGMALVYTALGIAAGLAGQGLAAFLQQPAVLVSFGLLLAVLSLSMFGVYELQLPAVLRDRLNAASQSISGGQIGGVFAMGLISALIVSPCVTAPLATVLLYISQTHDAALGGTALFAMAAGMSVPLLIVGTSAGSLLPRSGAWMERVKHVFGLLLLAMGIYIAQPAMPGLLAMILWGTLLVLGAASLGAFEPVPAGSAHPGGARLLRGVGLLLALLGVLQFVGIASGGRDPAQPLSVFAQGRALASAGADAASPDVASTSGATDSAGGAGSIGAGAAPGEPAFARVVSVAELDQRLQSADRPVMLDFYADWCVSCKEMEKVTFVAPAVKAKLTHAILLRADVTANTPEDRALLKRFDLFGPPGIILFDAHGHEVPGARVIGFQDSERFAASLTDAGL
jgi:thiol:disulfide interchange protein DsbD